MAFAFLFFQSATPSPAGSPEKLPAWLTLIYVIGAAFVALLLLISLVRRWLARSGGAATALANLPREILRWMGATAKHRGLSVWRWRFTLAENAWDDV